MSAHDEFLSTQKTGIQGGTEARVWWKLLSSDLRAGRRLIQAGGAEAGEACMGVREVLPGQRPWTVSITTTREHLPQRHSFSGWELAPRSLFSKTGTPTPFPDEADEHMEEEELSWATH